MAQRRQRERSLFEMLLPDGHKLWPDWLRRIDTALEDDAVIEVVAQALEKRWPQSRRRGRLGTPADVVIRMLILKHVFDWSYDDLEHEVRANLVYRAFTRIDAGDVPDAKTILKIARALGPEVIAQLHRQVVEVAKRAGVTHGRRFRVDTTVVETNVHYLTDSTLLQDGVRAPPRTMQHGCVALGEPRSQGDRFAQYRSGGAHQPPIAADQGRAALFATRLQPNRDTPARDTARAIANPLASRLRRTH